MVNKSNKNLFNVDIDAIKITLENANEIFTENIISLKNMYDLLPSKIIFEKDFDDSIAYIESSEKFLNESKQFRLANGKPFRDATKTVNDYYKSIDGSIEQELNIVKERMNAKVNEEYKIKKEYEQILSLFINDSPSPLATSSDGEIIIDSSCENSEILMEIELNKKKFKMQHTVVDYDLQNLDLNKLKDYFTKSSILSACKKHIRYENKKLDGVEYKAIAID